VHKAAHERYTRGHAPLVLGVLPAEELDQMKLLVRDPRAEELPGGDGVEHGADRVGQQHLRAHRPVKPTKVARMSYKRVDAGLDERVAALALLLDVVIEVGTLQNRQRKSG